MPKYISVYARVAAGLDEKWKREVQEICNAFLLRTFFAPVPTGSASTSTFPTWCVDWRSP